MFHVAVFNSKVVYCVVFNMNIIINTIIIIITVYITPYDTSAWVCFVRHQCKYMLEYLLSVTKYCSSQFDFLNKISRT